MAAASSADQNMSSFSNTGAAGIRLEEKTEASSSGIGGATAGDAEVPVKKQKVPRRILHFSDGTLEEYSTDEEEEVEDQVDHKPKVDPKKLTWLPWFWFYTMHSATKALNIADTCGEKLAWMFGITSPKYQYAIDEFNRIKEEEVEDKAREEREIEAMRLRKLQKMDNMEGGAEGQVNLAYSQSTMSMQDEQILQQEKY